MIMLSIGEPDFHPPASLVGMIDDRIRAGRTRYSNGRGEPEVLRCDRCAIIRSAPATR